MSKSKIIYIILTIAITLVIASCGKPPQEVNNKEIKTEIIEKEELTEIEPNSDNEEISDIELNSEKEITAVEVNSEEQLAEIELNNDKEEQIYEEELKLDLVPWPEVFIQGLPKPQGTVSNVSTDGFDWVAINMENISKENALGYIEELKEFGFTENINKEVDTNKIRFSASTQQNEIHIFFMWEDAEYTLIEIQK